MTLSLSIISAPSGELTVDSRAVAAALEIQHESILASLDAHQETIESEFGQLRFQIGAAKGGNNRSYETRFALLTENQAGFIATLSRNSPPVVRFKAWLVKEFDRARKSQAPARLPTPLETAMALVDALRNIERIKGEKAALALQAAKDAPLVEFAETVMASPDAVSLNEAAKVLGLRRNKMMADMRDARIIDHRNVPYQRYMDAGYFEVHESTYKDSKGTVHITMTTRVLQRGLDYLRKRFAGGANGQ